MPTSIQLHHLLTGLATQLPSMLAMLAGIVVAIVRWKRYPRVSMTLIVGLGLMLLHVVIFAVVYTMLPWIGRFEDWQRLQMFQSVVSIAYNLTLAIFTAIVLAAVFMQRRDPIDSPAAERQAQARAA